MHKPSHSGPARFRGTVVTATNQAGPIKKFSVCLWKKQQEFTLKQTISFCHSWSNSIFLWAPAFCFIQRRFPWRWDELCSIGPLRNRREVWANFHALQRHLFIPTPRLTRLFIVQVVKDVTDVHCVWSRGRSADVVPLVSQEKLGNSERFFFCCFLKSDVSSISSIPLKPFSCVRLCVASTAH